jgi:hypothetical protein
MASMRASSGISQDAENLASYDRIAVNQPLTAGIGSIDRR